jgi:hypothetical protein
MRTITASGHKVEIPAASYGNAHILTGIAAEIGGRQNRPVLINFPYVWNGPNRSQVALRNLRLIGVATPMAGPERVSIDLSHLSYVFPSGRSVFMEVTGYVSDNADGKEGVKGVFEPNIGKILQYGAPAAGAKGIADALTAANTTQVIGAETGTALVQTGDSLQNALLGGLGGMGSLVSQHFEGALKDVHASVDIPNGVPCTVILTKPVTFDVPAEEFQSLVPANSTNFYSER